jgi:DNA-binding transcriptional LysR family regulator
MPRIGALLLAALGLGIGLLSAGSAVAAAPPEEGQIVLFTPEKVWDETSWLTFVVRPGASGPVLRARGRQFRVFWNMTSITGKTTTDTLAAVAEGDTIDAAAVLDRPLTAAESRRFRVVPLYRDADVLVAAPGHPACASGLSLGQVQAILAGEVTAWPAVVAGWPAERRADIHALVPFSLEGKRSMFGRSRWTA